jgi:hypothetical protein
MVNANSFIYTNTYINVERYLNTTALHNPLIVTSVVAQEVGTENKLCMLFNGIEEQLTLNKTNLRTMVNARGADTDAWLGAKVTLAVVNTMFNGAVTKGVIIAKVE